jgi:hypothetical protein
MFKDGRTNVQYEEWSGQPSTESDDLVQSVDKKELKHGASQLQNFSENFHKFHALFSMRLPQVLRKMGFEIAHRYTQNAGMASALTFFFFFYLPQRWQWIS